MRRFLAPAEFHSSRSSPVGLLPGGWSARRHPSLLSRVAVIAGSTWHILQRHTVIWDTLKDCNCFKLVVRQCFNQVEHKGQLKNRAKAIRVPSIRMGRVLPHAFTHTIDVRHVQVEAGQRCTRLQIVQLPSTVVCLQDGAFRRNYVLRTVTAPGCKYFGLWVFEECYSLAQIGDQSTTVNQLAPQAQFRPRAFEKRSTLQQLNFERTEYDPTNLNRSIPEGCFVEAGIESLYLPADFNWMGPAACELCKRLRSVDISQTEIREILGAPLHTARNYSNLGWPKR